MAIDEQDNENVDTQGMMLFMFNAIQALALAHPNRAVFRDVLGRAGKQQIELFESRGARTELIDAYEYYSEKLLAVIPDTNVDIDLDLELKF